MVFMEVNEVRLIAQSVLITGVASAGTIAGSITVLPTISHLNHARYVCTWAQDERPADLHMAQPNVPVSKTGQIKYFVTVQTAGGLPTSKQH
jgi:hypothetical protein